MSRFLLVDVGAGTVDILYYDTDSDIHYKAVAKSPVRRLAEDIARTEGPLLVTGGEMGGGPVTEILKKRARDGGVVISASAAQTLHHNPQVVRGWGLEVVEDDAARKLAGRPGRTHVRLGDVEVRRLARIVEAFGVPLAFDAVAFCAQDHGVPPPGVSHLDFRHNLFRERLAEAPLPHALLFEAGEVPPVLNRLGTIARDAAALPAGEVYVMDSGMAAILGASLDAAARGRQRVYVMDAATSHTVGAALEGGELAGFFEYHTADITCERLQELFEGLAGGTLSHRRVLAEGGHGAWVRRPLGLGEGDVIVATGPKRHRVAAARLPLVFGAPLGDNMMTGTLGLLEALRRRKGLGPVLNF